MKTYIKSIVAILCLGIFSCEEVIDVDVPTGPTRLVIEGTLDWEKGTTGNNQSINLRTTTPYFDTTTNVDVTGASVIVTNLDTNEEFVFTDQNDGSYTTSTFNPIVGNTYQLDVIHNGETYRGTETLIAVSGINEVTQTVEGGFDDELIDINIFWDDPVDEENFYLARFFRAGDLFPTFDDQDDEFTNGNELDEFFEPEDDEDENERPLEAGDEVDIRLFGISEGYYNYVRILLEQYDSGGDPFSTVPVDVRGNMINITNESNYPYGYFFVSEFDVRTYTVQ